ncbi:MAG: hypothetical protein ACPG7R_08030, partial [Planctomycetota bacterium]
MTIEWVTPHWIWALIPLLLIGWWSLRRGQRPSSSRNVASLQLWDRLKVVPPPSNRWLTLLPVVMLALLSGGPRLLDSPKHLFISTNVAKYYLNNFESLIVLGYSSCFPGEISK